MNKAAQTLGRLAKGVKKTITKAESSRRSKRLAEARKLRHPKQWVIQTPSGYVTGLKFAMFGISTPDVHSGPLANAIRYTKAQAANICGLLGAEYTPMQEGSAV
jgi:hypothetical protein